MEAHTYKGIVESEILSRVENELKRKCFKCETKKKIHDKYIELWDLVEQFFDEDECHYDHHGYCQTHNGHERPCPHETAKKLLRK